MWPFSRNDEHSRVILRFDCMMFQLREGQPTDRTDWIDSIINRRLYTKSRNIHLMSGFPIGRIGRAVIPINQKYFHQESTRSRFPFRAPHLTTAESSSIEIITKSPTHKHTHIHTHTQLVGFSGLGLLLASVCGDSRAEAEAICILEWGSGTTKRTVHTSGFLTIKSRVKCLGK